MCRVGSDLNATHHPSTTAAGTTCLALSEFLLGKVVSKTAWSDVTCDEVASVTWAEENNTLTLKQHLALWGEECCAAVANTRCKDSSNMCAVQAEFQPAADSGVEGKTCQWGSDWALDQIPGRTMWGDVTCSELAATTSLQGTVESVLLSAAAVCCQGATASRASCISPPPLAPGSAPVLPENATGATDDAANPAVPPSCDAAACGACTCGDFGRLARAALCPGRFVLAAAGPNKAAAVAALLHSSLNPQATNASAMSTCSLQADGLTGAIGTSISYMGSASLALSAEVAAVPRRLRFVAHSKVLSHTVSAHAPFSVGAALRVHYQVWTAEWSSAVRSWEGGASAGRSASEVAWAPLLYVDGVAAAAGSCTAPSASTGVGQCTLDVSAFFSTAMEETLQVTVGHSDIGQYSGPEMEANTGAWTSEPVAQAVTLLRRAESADTVQSQFAATSTAGAVFLRLPLHPLFRGQSFSAVVRSHSGALQQAQLQMRVIWNSVAALQDCATPSGSYICALDANYQVTSSAFGCGSVTSSSYSAPQACGAGALSWANFLIEKKSSGSYRSGYLDIASMAFTVAGGAADARAAAGGDGVITATVKYFKHADATGNLLDLVGTAPGLLPSDVPVPVLGAEGTVVTQAGTQALPTAARLTILSDAVVAVYGWVPQLDMLNTAVLDGEAVEQLATVRRLHAFRPEPTDAVVDACSADQPDVAAAVPGGAGATSQCAISLHSTAPGGSDADGSSAIATDAGDMTGAGSSAGSATARSVRLHFRAWHPEIERISVGPSGDNRVTLRPISAVASLNATSAGSDVAGAAADSCAVEYQRARVAVYVRFRGGPSIATPRAVDATALLLRAGKLLLQSAGRDRALPPCAALAAIGEYGADVTGLPVAPPDSVDSNSSSGSIGGCEVTLLVAGFSNATNGSFTVVAPGSAPATFTPALSARQADPPSMHTFVLQDGATASESYSVSHSESVPSTAAGGGVVAADGTHSCRFDQEGSVGRVYAFMSYSYGGGDGDGDGDGHVRAVPPGKLLVSSLDEATLVPAAVSAAAAGAGSGVIGGDVAVAVGAASGCGMLVRGVYLTGVGDGPGGGCALAGGTTPLSLLPAGSDDGSASAAITAELSADAAAVVDMPTVCALVLEPAALARVAPAGDFASLYPYNYPTAVGLTSVKATFCVAGTDTPVAGQVGVEVLGDPRLQTALAPAAAGLALSNETAAVERRVRAAVASPSASGYGAGEATLVVTFLGFSSGRAIEVVAFAVTSALPVPCGLELATSHDSIAPPGDAALLRPFLLAGYSSVTSVQVYFCARGTSQRSAVKGSDSWAAVSEGQTVAGAEHWNTTVAIVASSAGVCGSGPAPSAIATYDAASRRISPALGGCGAITLRAVVGATFALGHPDLGSPSAANSSSNSGGGSSSFGSEISTTTGTATVDVLQFSANASVGEWCVANGLPAAPPTAIIHPGRRTCAFACGATVSASAGTVAKAGAAATMPPFSVASASTVTDVALYFCADACDDDSGPSPSCAPPTTTANGFAGSAWTGFGPAAGDLRPLLTATSHLVLDASTGTAAAAADRDGEGTVTVTWPGFIEPPCPAHAASAAVRVVALAYVNVTMAKQSAAASAPPPCVGGGLFPPALPSAECALLRIGCSSRYQRGQLLSEATLTDGASRDVTAYSSFASTNASVAAVVTAPPVASSGDVVVVAAAAGATAVVATFPAVGGSCAVASGCASRTQSLWVVSSAAHSPVAAVSAHPFPPVLRGQQDSASLVVTASMRPPAAGRHSASRLQPIVTLGDGTVYDFGASADGVSYGVPVHEVLSFTASGCAASDLTYGCAAVAAGGQCDPASCNGTAIAIDAGSGLATLRGKTLRSDAVTLTAVAAVGSCGVLQEATPWALPEESPSAASSSPSPLPPPAHTVRVRASVDAAPGDMDIGAPSAGGLRLVSSSSSESGSGSSSAVDGGGAVVRVGDIWSIPVYANSGSLPVTAWQFELSLPAGAFEFVGCESVAPSGASASAGQCADADADACWPGDWDFRCTQSYAGTSLNVAGIGLKLDNDVLGGTLRLATVTVRASPAVAAAESTELPWMSDAADGLGWEEITGQLKVLAVQNSNAGGQWWGPLPPGGVPMFAGSGYVAVGGAGDDTAAPAAGAGGRRRLLSAGPRSSDAAAMVAPTSTVGAAAGRLSRRATEQTAAEASAEVSATGLIDIGVSRERGVALADANYDGVVDGR
jgi:hypothetical protein